MCDMFWFFSEMLSGLIFEILYMDRWKGSSSNKFLFPSPINRPGLTNLEILGCPKQGHLPQNPWMMRWLSRPCGPIWRILVKTDAPKMTKVINEGGSLKLWRLSWDTYHSLKDRKLTRDYPRGHEKFCPLLIKWEDYIPGKHNPRLKQFQWRLNHVHYTAGFWAREPYGYRNQKLGMYLRKIWLLTHDPLFGPGRPAHWEMKKIMMEEYRQAKYKPLRKHSSITGQRWYASRIYRDTYATTTPAVNMDLIPRKFDRQIHMEVPKEECKNCGKPRWVTPDPAEPKFIKFLKSGPDPREAFDAFGHASAGGMVGITFMAVLISATWWATYKSVVGD